MRLPEIPGLLADPAASSPGATLGCAFFGYFLCTSKESDSRNARNAFLLRRNGKSQRKIKMDPNLTSYAVESRRDDD